MPSQLDRSMMQAYVQRWQDVAEFEANELRQSSSSQRWQKLNALVRMAAELGLELESDDAQDAIVRERWNRLRASYLMQGQAQR